MRWRCHGMCDVKKYRSGLVQALGVCDRDGLATNSIADAVQPQISIISFPASKFGK